MDDLPRAPRRHRTLWISDVHLGSPGCKAKALATFLRRNDADALYLVGDIVDGWKLKSKFFWTPDHSRVVQAILAKARRGTQVHYITGNHDGFLRQFVAQQMDFGHIRFVDEVVHTTADGRQLLVTHGDDFDDVVSGWPRLAGLADVAYSGLMVVDRVARESLNVVGLPAPPISAFAKFVVKSAVRIVSDVDGKMLSRCVTDRLQGVVTGHTHHAEIRHLRSDVVSYNCGDWVESCTALAESDEGVISLMTLPDPELLALRRMRRMRQGQREREQQKSRPVRAAFPVTPSAVRTARRPSPSGSPSRRGPGG